ncbi:hypothetical protein GCM10010472_71350 [Pseudonocardia halophobica]|uniref:Uncharacterized protein n=1 Tax=Pseudonocardia halophobica TaxID=29401 RepID=A0A9W6NVU8_9PSEU|nr:hypothetical protein GCM10017577_21340 [Pseudonocardia halophobica]
MPGPDDEPSDSGKGEIYVQTRVTGGRDAEARVVRARGPRVESDAE